MYLDFQEMTLLQLLRLIPVEEGERASSSFLVEHQ